MAATKFTTLSRTLAPEIFLIIIVPLLQGSSMPCAVTHSARLVWMVYTTTTEEESAS